MDQISTSVADESVVEVGFGESVAAVNQGSRRAGEIPRGTTAAFDRAGHQPGDAPMGADNAPGFFRADAVNLGGGTVHGNAFQGGRHRIKGIPASITIVVHVKANMIAVVAGEPASEIVEAQPVLPPAGFGSEGHASRLDHEVPTMQVQRAGLGMPQGPDEGAVTTGRPVNTVVEAPNETIEHRLDVDPLHAFGKTSENGLTDVGLPVPIGILEE